MLITYVARALPAVTDLYIHIRDIYLVLRKTSADRKPNPRLLCDRLVGISVRGDPRCGAKWVLHTKIRASRVQDPDLLDRSSRSSHQKNPRNLRTHTNTTHVSNIIYCTTQTDVEAYEKHVHRANSVTNILIITSIVCVLCMVYRVLTVLEKHVIT